MFWRAYFWNYAAFTFVGLIIELARPSADPLRQMIGLVFTPVALVALGGRAFNPQLLTAGTWRTLLVASVGWETFALAIGISPSSAVVASAGVTSPTPGMPSETARFIRTMTEVVIPGAVWLSALPPLLALYLNAHPKAKPSPA